ncbi:MAG: PAS domain S-box protein [Proteobacteria bacterium]|nr:PAS domain S-box protein [Pseudomonadota bacterium]MBU1712321.1 PAS domain S-box protein [Pseudomonadota bacterium]
MKDQSKTNQELFEELSSLKQKNKELNRSESERNRAEPEVIQAEKDWGNIFQAISHPTVILDPHHVIVAANKAVVSASGMSAKDLVGRKCYEIFHGKDTVSPPKCCPMESLLASGCFETEDMEMEAFEGVFLVSCTPVFDQKGCVEKIIHIATDITKRKQAEEALQKSEEKYRNLFENANEAIFVVQDGKLVFLNPMTAEITGYSEEELMSRPFAEFIYQDDRDMVLGRHIKRMKGEELPHVYSFRIIHKEGNIIWGELNVVLINWKDKAATLNFLSDITERRQVEEQLQQTLESLRRSFDTTIQVMISAIEIRDPYTSGHQIRSANIARAIAKEMDFSQDIIEAIRMAGPIHDIGKLSVPAEILSKPGRLTDIEFSLIKQHTLKGYEMLKDVESPWPLAEIVYQHHERMDGSGYPRGLKGEEILMEARILSVADVVEAMASHRPYRAGLGIDAALNEIEKNRRIFYDNTVADACLRLFREKGFKLEAA